jgi:hypothetical protein
MPFPGTGGERREALRMTSTDIVEGSKTEYPENDGSELYQLGYVSTGVRPMGSAELLDLLKISRDNNLAHDITGLLLHRQDSFFQVIEGSHRSVDEILEKISRDPRHQRIEIMFEGPIEEREFDDWRMGFLELDNVDLRLVPGFTEFLEDGVEPREFLAHLSRSKRLALLFRSMA